MLVGAIVVDCAAAVAGGLVAQAVAAAALDRTLLQRKQHSG